MYTFFGLKIHDIIEFFGDITGKQCAEGTKYDSKLINALIYLELLQLMKVHRLAELYSTVPITLTLQIQYTVYLYFLFWLFTDFAEGIRLPTANGGVSWDTGKTRTMEDSSYVDDNLIIKNPGRNDGNRQQ